MVRQQIPELVLLQAKLHRPHITKDLIIRSRLLTLLDAGLSAPLSIVVAPAGFGKTTLVGSWIEELTGRRRPGIDPVLCAWLSLDEGDSEINAFLRYFVGALRTIFPEAAPKTLELLSARQPTLDVLAEMLSNEIEALPSDFVMVLDDAHLLSGRSVFDFLTAWTRHWPRPIHMVLVSRLTPSLPLTTLRAGGNLIEVRSRDLRFTTHETAAYLNQRLGSSVDGPDLAAVQQKLEGWVAGLKLATLTSDVGVHAQTLSQEFLSGQARATDYLIDEVLLRQPAEIQRLLLKISITGQFCKPLCEALLCDEGPEFDIRAHLDYLESNELFIVALDNQQEWYRLHQLLRDLLRRRLGRELGQTAADALHGRAARWYAAEGLIDQALYHALEGKNLALAGEIMQQGLCDVLNHTDRPVLERWLRMLPDELINNRPELLVMRAWAHGLRWEISQGQGLVEQLEALLGDGWLDSATDTTAILIGQVAAIKAHSAYNMGQFESAVICGRKAFQLLPPEWSFARGAGALYLGLGLYACGEIAEAERFLTTHYEAAAHKVDVYSLRLLQTLALNTLQQGLFESTKRTALILQRQSEQAGIPVILGWAHNILGYLHYEWNELELARQHFEATLELRYSTQLLVARNGFIGLAGVYQARGENARSLATIDELSRLDLELYGQETIPTTAARARLLLRQGDLDGADLWSERITLPPPIQPLFPWTEEPLLTRANVLIARNTPADIATALKALDYLDEMSLRTFSLRARVEILALRALARMAQGDTVAARESLIQSVELARRTGQIRVYVDLGLPMKKLMVQIAGHRTITNATAGILAAFELNGSNGSVSTDHYGDATAGPALSESLTTRELEILRLMVEPMSLVQIAGQLDITRGTVKRHSINLYEKLGVHTRWEAVARAAELGILPPR